LIISALGLEQGVIMKIVVSSLDEGRRILNSYRRDED